MKVRASVVVDARRRWPRLDSLDLGVGAEHCGRAGELHGALRVPDAPHHQDEHHATTSSATTISAIGSSLVKIHDTTTAMAPATATSLTAAAPPPPVVGREEPWDSDHVGMAARQGMTRSASTQS